MNLTNSVTVRINGADVSLGHAKLIYQQLKALFDQNTPARAVGDYWPNGMPDVGRTIFGPPPPNPWRDTWCRPPTHCYKGGTRTVTASFIPNQAEPQLY